MSGLLNKMLNFVGLEAEDEEVQEHAEEEKNDSKDKVEQPSFLQFNQKKPQQNKIVNIHSNNQLKVVVMQPAKFDDAQEVCDHLKNKKPIIVNLESLEKEAARRVVDFLSGAVYSLDGNIQKVSNGIFIIAPNNVDIMGELNGEINAKSGFTWLK
jgi:cell division inhibitor SepF